MLVFGVTVFPKNNRFIVLRNLKFDIAMAASNPDSENIRALIRSTEVPEPKATAKPPENQATERVITMPWEEEGEFEIEALIVSQGKGDLLVKVPKGDEEIYLTITGFLPGKVTKQRWRLECVRESGQLELLDGNPL